MKYASVQSDHADGAGHRGRVAHSTPATQGHKRRGGEMPNRITADDFFAGLFAGLAMRGLTTFSVRIDQFDPVVKGVFEELADEFVDAYSGACSGTRSSWRGICRDGLSKDAAHVSNYSALVLVR